MASAYKMRCSVAGHEKDVRAVIAAAFPANAIISGSRDVTARVWVPNMCVYLRSSPDKLLSTGLGDNREIQYV